MDIKISDMIIRELLPDMVEDEDIWNTQLILYIYVVLLHLSNII